LKKKKKGRSWGFFVLNVKVEPEKGGYAFTQLRRGKTEGWEREKKCGESQATLGRKNISPVIVVVRGNRYWGEQLGSVARGERPGPLYSNLQGLNRCASRGKKDGHCILGKPRKRKERKEIRD